MIDTFTSASTQTYNQSFDTSSVHLPSPASPNLSSFLSGLALPENPMSCFSLSTHLLLHITGAAKISEISTLVLKDVGLSDFRSNSEFDLLELETLQELNLNQNYIQDVSPISVLTSLEVLTLDHNHLSQISPLKTLVNLKFLSLANNDLTHLNGFPILEKLAELKLTNNRLTNGPGVISVLERLPALVNLCIDGNPFMHQQKHMHYKLLIQLRLQSLDGEEVTSFDSTIAQDVVHGEHSKKKHLNGHQHQTLFSGATHKTVNSENREEMFRALICAIQLDPMAEQMLKLMRERRSEDFERAIEELTWTVLDRHIVVQE